MKKLCSLPTSLVLIATTLLFFFSCKKINEATTLGNELVPEADNINTFETTFAAETDNVMLNDTAKLVYSDPVALGTITNDPEFGQTAASVYFQINPSAYGTYPYTAKNPTIDSVVLSLSYLGGYGDTTIPQTVSVYEIAQTSGFNDVTYYPFTNPDIETTGPALGTATFTFNHLKDSITLIHKDTTRVANQLRIRLDNALGERLASYDTTNSSNGGYYNDTLFKTLFRGFALKTDAGTGNGLGFFALNNATKTNLIVYYRAANNGKTDTAKVIYTHALRYTTTTNTSAGGQANTIRRQPAGGWAAHQGDGAPIDQTLYIQSTPGSVGYIKIPALDTFQNKLIHRAELIATRVPSAMDNFFVAPSQLFVDQYKTGTDKDSAFNFQEFVGPDNSGIWRFNLQSFGGTLRTDNTYRFNITAAVQDIIARHKPNLLMRIYAPYDTRPYALQGTEYKPTFVQAIPYPAYGRVVLAGGNYAEAGMQMRLRIIYSNL